MSSFENLTRRDALIGSAAGAALAAATVPAAADNKPPAIAAPANAKAVVVTLRLSAKDAAVRQHLMNVIPVTRLASGCRYSHSYQETKAPAEFLLVQGWDSIEQQQGYIAWRQARGDLAQFGAFLAKDPLIEVFDLFDA